MTSESCVLDEPQSQGGLSASDMIKESNEASWKSIRGMVEVGYPKEGSGV